MQTHPLRALWRNHLIFLCKNFNRWPRLHCSYRSSANRVADTSTSYQEHSALGSTCDVSRFSRLGRAASPRANFLWWVPVKIFHSERGRNHPFHLCSFASPCLKSGAVYGLAIWVRDGCHAKWMYPAAPTGHAIIIKTVRKHRFLSTHLSFETSRKILTRSTSAFA